MAADNRGLQILLEPFDFELTGEAQSLKPPNGPPWA
jgi:hypothetical protein